MEALAFIVLGVIQVAAAIGLIYLIGLYPVIVLPGAFIVGGIGVLVCRRFSGKPGATRQ